MGKPEGIVGGMPNNPTYIRGIRVVQDREGFILLSYVENSDSPFRSPVMVNITFETWAQAINYLKLWDLLQYVQWW